MAQMLGPSVVDALVAPRSALGLSTGVVVWLLQLWAAPQRVVAQQQSAVLSLNLENFAQVVKANHLIMVAFYAPWCGHCRQLEPEFEKAATTMLGRVAFAKVDATVEVELSEEHNVQGYPTLQLFKSGTPEDFTGGRVNASIVKWVEEHIGPALTEVATDDQLQPLLKQRRSTTYFVAKGDDAMKELFRTLAGDSPHLGVFIFVPGAAGDAPSVQIHRGTDEVVTFEEAELSDAETIRSSLVKEALPPFGEITDDNYAAYAGLAGQGLLWVCLHPDSVDEDAERLGDVFRQVAFAFQQFRVAYIDPKAYEEHVEQELGCTEFPSVVLQHGDFANAEVELKHYRTALPGEVTAERVVGWINDVLAGKVEEDDDFEVDNAEPQDVTGQIKVNPGHGEEL